MNKYERKAQSHGRPEKDVSKTAELYARTIPTYKTNNEWAIRDALAEAFVAGYNKRQAELEPPKKGAGAI